ncbi:antibiotic biosynthesis monooxygenase [Phialemonium atrogriseum]|uniref:Antibiotic biosynthesis monooxygenase n=1 Tax=Phialemonium atrogriseum TaxID=1093897 RepID=A0AAJ0BNR9_9PEZI|nr:antibiotic biosynthesis monooxygenase [Phialemonium atrogriseum]KAK1761693.1 antibiotic biosynthesis monooxygenase [Phialemonium atrogriseum]
MFTVIFEVRPAKWDAYLALAKSLRPALEQVEGFTRNIRYRSLRRDGWLLSLSDWADEKALVRWRTREAHHCAQQRGREEVLEDYHLRVGEVVVDEGGGSREDVTRVGTGPAVTLLEIGGGVMTEREEAYADADTLARAMGLDTSAVGLVSWDVFNVVLSPQDLILVCTWETESAAIAFSNGLRGKGREGIKCRVVRVVRDYGKYDRREAPQFYPDVPGQETLHM